jgi:hypothetical protein
MSRGNELVTCSRHATLLAADRSACAPLHPYCNITQSCNYTDEAQMVHSHCSQQVRVSMGVRARCHRAACAAAASLAGRKSLPGRPVVALDLWWRKACAPEPAFDRLWMAHVHKLKRSRRPFHREASRIAPRPQQRPRDGAPGHQALPARLPPGLAPTRDKHQPTTGCHGRPHATHRPQMWGGAIQMDTAKMSSAQTDLALAAPDPLLGAEVCMGMACKPSKMVSQTAARMCHQCTCMDHGTAA